MKKIRQIFSQMNSRLPLYFVLIVGLIASRSLFTRGYFIMHDDLQMMRLMEMEKCFLDGQIPCRWVPDMGNGYGFPLFNFYPPLPYLVGEIFRLLGFAFTTSVKLTFALTLILSGFSMYFLAKKFYGKVGGVLSAVFYIWAPYRAVDVFVRGAMNESWAFVFFPLLLLFAHDLITTKENIKKPFILLSVSYALLFLSHNIMVLIFTPFFTLWCLAFLVLEKSWKKIIYLTLAGILALGLAAFFTLPAYFEKDLVHVETLVLGYYDFSGHFATLKQLFLSRFWGDTSSAFGENDGMAFPVGHIHWIISAVVALWIGINILIRKHFDKKLFIPVFALFVGFMGTFMAHSKSTFLWQIFPILKYVQFPWRFLTLSSFGLSFAIGGLAMLINNKSQGTLSAIFRKSSFFVLTIILTIIVISWNLVFFKPVRTGPVTDAEKFSGEAWRLQQGAGIYDYLPNTAKEAPIHQRGGDISVEEGSAQLSNYTQGTYWNKFDAVVKSENAKIRIETMYFPNWRVFLMGNNLEELKVEIPDRENWGRMWVELPRGNHVVYSQFFNTPVRTVSNLISLFSFGILAALLVRRQADKFKND